MPPKVDPTEVRFSKAFLIQSTLKFSVVNLGPPLLLLPSSALSVSYISHNQERQKGW